MGLIKAALGSAGGVLADQWKEYFYCEALPENVMAVKGQKRTSGRSSNTKGGDNIISNGSVIAVADGQCMLIVDQGKIVDMCAVPGEYTYDQSTEPSIFVGDLGEGIKNVFNNMANRFTFGGEAPNAPVLILMWAFAASASTATASAIPPCSIPMCAATWRRPIPETSWTAS